MKRLVVVGDALLDRDLVGTASRLAPDAPVPVVDAPVDRPRPGGAALAAVLAAATCLTLVEFPAHYADVVAGEPLWSLLVAARNALLLAAVALAVRELSTIRTRAREGATARSPWRARPGRPRPAPR